MTRNWQEYYQQTKNKPPAPLLVKALGFVVNKNRALDLGSGTLQDSRYLLEQGFKKVIAVDKEAVPPEILKDFKGGDFEFIHTSFSKFDFSENKYDLVNAQYSLPFNGKGSFNELFTQIKNSLNHEGIFVGQLFGNRDEWSSGYTDVVFHTKGDIDDLLDDMEVIECTEVEKDGKLANGNPKHWHVFHIIAKR